MRIVVVVIIIIIVIIMNLLAAEPPLPRAASGTRGRGVRPPRLRPISLLISSLLRFVDSPFPGLMDMRIPPPKVKILCLSQTQNLSTEIGCRGLRRASPATAAMHPPVPAAIN